MHKAIFLLVTLPILTGAFCLLAKAGKTRRNLSLCVFIAAFVSSLFYFTKVPLSLSLNLLGDFRITLALNNLSRVILIFTNLFGLLICLYSRSYSSLKENRFYFSFLLWLIASANLVCLSQDIVLFVFAWGITLALLYALLSLGSSESANKALMVVGFGDFSLILGICLYAALSGSTTMPQGYGLVLNNPLSWLSFVLMLIGALAKAGCGPFHTWIPAVSEDAPLPVMAILPASLDKLLGIYLLARICVDFFILNDLALAVLLIIGALTIIFAVMMALVQHDLRKLLAYHSISQVGYMVLGFGTGTALGVAAAIFHMVNNALYKSGLFLTGASVGEKKNTFELKELGALASMMPITFACGLIFALSISGVPLFNGFVSKWMLYQGTIIGLFNTQNLFLRLVYIFALLAAMFGSALTLASFIKFIHAIFLGQDMSAQKTKVSEVSGGMKTAVLVLAGICVILGIFPGIFIKMCLSPWFTQELSFIGNWNSSFAFVFLFFGLLFGLFIYKRITKQKIRQDDLFIGGEEPVFSPSFPATEFYRTIEEVPLVSRLYKVIKLEALDLYNILGSVLRVIAYFLFIFVDRLINLLTSSAGYTVLGISWLFRKMHTGVLDLYLAWSLFGLIIVFLILLAR